MDINFFYEDISFRLNQPENTKKWIAAIVQAEDYLLTELNYIFCSDTYLHKINLDFLNHDTYTDIITFDHNETEKQEIQGEIYISIDRVKENAGTYKKPFEQELHRVIIHGVLHLLGYQDKSEAEKKEMRKKEEACLSLQNLN